MTLTPLDYARLLCESFKRSKELIPEEKIQELMKEIQATFPDIPDKIARMYIDLHNEALNKRKRKRKRKKKVSKPKKEAVKVEIEYTKTELKIKKVINDWLDYWDREEHIIIHPITLVAKADLELNCGYEKAWEVVRKMSQEGNMYVK